MRMPSWQPNTDPRTGTSTMAYHTAAGKIGLPASETDAAGNATSYEYDTASGRLLWKKNALNHYTRYAYNARGQQTRVWGDAEYPVEYGYDQYGQKVTMTTFRGGSAWDGENWPNPAPVGDTTTWTFDAASGAVTAKTYADGHGPAYTYTPDGKLATRTWARTDANNNPLTTTYSYDDATGELVGIDYSDSTPDISYTYTRTGQPATVTDAAGTRTFAYNAQLQEVSETISGGLYSKTLTRSYTTTGMKGRKLGLAVDGVANYSYGYDAYGRLNKITTPAGDFDYTRLADSDLVAQMTRPNGVTTTWSYESNRNLITQVANGTISTYGYTNDAIGRRTSMSRSGSAHPTPDTISYSYNDRSEVTGATSNNIPSYTYAYSYDPIGNRTSASEAGVPWTYATNNLNQYTSATEDNVQLNFTYDLDGSMTYRPVDANSGWTQVWNGENRMVETFKGTDRLEFKYDYMGRRVEKCVYSNNTLTSKTLFVYDGFKCVEELDALNGNTVLMRHTWQPFDVGLDVILATTNVANTSFFLHDANKNVTQKISSNGAFQDAYAYAPFGKSIGPDLAYIGYSSEATEEVPGLIYYNYRFLSVLHGRWISCEPNPNIEPFNAIAYINNNVICNFDYLGNEAYSVHVGTWGEIDILIGSPRNDDEWRWCRDQDDRQRAGDRLHAGCCNGQPFDERTSCCENNVPVSKVPIWICIRSLDVKFFRGFILGPISHSFISCDDPNLNPISERRFGKQPRKGEPEGIFDPYIGPGYVRKEPKELPTDPKSCEKKMICPAEEERMCQEGPTETPYFLFSPIHNCHGWANCRSK